MWKSRSKGNKTETLHWTSEEKMQWIFSLFFPLWTISKWISLLLQNICLLLRGTRPAAPRSPARRAESTGEGSILPSASCLPSSGCRAGAPRRSTSSHTPSDPAQVPQAAPARLANHGPLSPNRGEGTGGAAMARPCWCLCVPPVPQFFDTLAGRCNSHISGNLLPVCLLVFCFFLNSFEKIMWLSVCRCVILCLRWSANAGCWTSPSLFICRNTLVRGASVGSVLCIECKRRMDATERYRLSCW